MNTASLINHQTSFQLKSFFRNRSGMVFAFLFPIMFLVIFSLGAGGRTTEFRGTQVPFLQFFLPGILAYGIIGACYTNLAMRVTNMRESGVLKRVLGTPLPPIAYLAGLILSSVVIAIILSALTTLIGVLGYGVHLYIDTLPAVIVTALLGAGTFCALGLAMASVVPNADAAPAIVNFTMFPILFISDVFYSVADAPDWLQKFAGIFPIKHLANALQVAFSPETTGAGFSGKDLLVLAAWCVVGVVLATRNFRWESRSSKS